MARFTRMGKSESVRISPVLTPILLLLSVPLFAQQPTCSVSNSLPTVNAEGLAEQVGNITFSCSGGTGVVNTLIVITVNTYITNRMDANGNLLGITVSGATVPSSQPPSLNSPTSVTFPLVQFPGVKATFTISGIRVAAALIPGGYPIVAGAVYAPRITFKLANQVLFLAQGLPTLLSSVVNIGVPCQGSPAFSPLPATVDFYALIAAGTASSAVRVTSASPGVFAPKSPTSDSGVRFLVSLSGYGSNARVYVPDVIVGNVTTATSAGAFSTPANAGAYSPGNNELLLARVAGADSTGAGGIPFLGPGAAGMPLSPTSVSQLNLVNGAGTVTYEVIAAPASIESSAQIPVFVVVPPSACPNSLQNSLSVTLAPESTVTIPTQTDPIPRYIPTMPASDCMVIGDCSAVYYPVLQIAQTSISMTGSTQGKAQSAVIPLNNGGASQMNFNVSINYYTGAGLSPANWLSASVTNGLVGPSTFAPLTLTANPAALVMPGVYQAFVTIDAGSAGYAVLPVTFTVAQGPAIQSVVNSANFQVGPVAANSYATIFGSNLAPATPTPVAVTFAGANATVIYDGPTQMNVLIPEGLTSATTASVVATIDGVPSNSFMVNLAPNALAVFNPGIENQDYSVNSASAPASIANGETIQIFLTGLATVAAPPVTVNIGGVSLVNTNTSTPITYAGPVPSVPGLEQVNVQLPSTLPPGSASLSICVPGAAGQQPICSAGVPVYLH